MMQEAEHLYFALLEASDRAFASQLYTVAYHALGGAMQCAVFLKDTGKLSQVERGAREHHKHLQIHFADRPTCVEFDLYLSLIQMAKTHLILSPKKK